MPDIDLRFNRDMLVISAPVESALRRQGYDPDRDLNYLNLMEPDAIRNALRMESTAGAQCLVASTAKLTQAQLAHARMEDDASKLAHEALTIVAELKPQHVLVEMTPCGLPLDPSSKASLNENRAQYAGAARAFADEAFDAVFLNGFTRVVDLKCALMGVAQVTGKPIMASVILEGSGVLVGDGSEFTDAVAAMADLGASVVGFETGEPPIVATAFVKQAAACADLPIMAQLRVAEHAPRQGGPTAANPYYCPDAMEQAGVALYGAGVQFLRATGAATPAYTGALAATLHGLDVRQRQGRAE